MPYQPSNIKDILNRAVSRAIKDVVEQVDPEPQKDVNPWYMYADALERQTQIPKKSVIRPAQQWGRTMPTPAPPKQTEKKSTNDPRMAYFSHSKSNKPRDVYLSAFIPKKGR